MAKSVQMARGIWRIKVPVSDVLSHVIPHYPLGALAALPNDLQPNALRWAIRYLRRHGQWRK